MKFNNVAVLAASSLFSATTVQAQHDQTYTLSYNTAQNQFITSIGGRLQIPALPSTNGQYNIRSGVNSADNSGKLATVLSSDSGSWAATSAWTGSGASSSKALASTEGHAVLYNLTKQNDIWNAFTNIQQSYETNQTDYSLGDKSFSQGFFEIELTNAVYTFSNITFTDVVILATGDDTSWCNDTPQVSVTRVTYAVSGARGSASNGGVQCNIDSVVLEFPTSV